MREVAGFAPYERRLIDLCRNNLDKRALRLAKRKLRTHGRAKRSVVAACFLSLFCAPAGVCVCALFLASFMWLGAFVLCVMFGFAQVGWVI